MEFLFWTSYSQDNSLQTKSVSINDFISFVVNHVPSLSQKAESENIKTNQNFTFLIETKEAHLSKEDVTILQQGFKILSSKLGNKDSISIALYGVHNGLLLSKTPHSELKKILHSFTNLQNLVMPYNEAIGETFAYASNIANKSSKTAKNTLAFLTNDFDVAKQKQAVTTESFVSNSKNQTLNTKKAKVEMPEKTSSKNGSVVLLTAITLLPEIIQIIKG